MSLYNQVDRMYDLSQFQCWQVGSSEYAVICKLADPTIQESAHVIFTKSGKYVEYTSFILDNATIDDGTALAWKERSATNPSRDLVDQHRRELTDYITSESHWNKIKNNKDTFLF